jgi:DNA helicase-2/ATP-dependent DNA helicase PcrA
MNFTPRPAQQGILNYTHGKMGISAVPGSGKTHTLSALAAKLIRSGRIGDEQEVLIVTLVNSAVDNFTDRIKDFLGSSMPFGYRVRTLHGLANDIVHEKPEAVGLEDRFTILDEREADLIRKRAANAWLQVHSADLDVFLADMDESKRTWIYRDQIPGLVADVAMAFIRTAKDSRLTPEKLRILVDNAPAPLPLAEMGLAIFSDYQRGLNYRGAVDFDDLIRLAIDLLENDAGFLERLRYRWPFILEDEAQDSSKLQEQILRLLAGPDGNWARVGDPNQAIFETFTTASPKHLLDFIHKEADSYNTLPDSGRSQPRIIELANRLIQWVNDEHPEPDVRDALTIPMILPASPDDPQPNPPDNPGGIKLIGKKYSPEEEVDAVVRSISKWLPEHPAASVAVLVPRNLRGTDVITALKAHSIDFVELLGSTSSTREATLRIGHVVGALSDPQSPVRLAKAYLAWKQEDTSETSIVLYNQVSDLLQKCHEIETFISPHAGNDWLVRLVSEGINSDILVELGDFRKVFTRWQGTIQLPIDQTLLTLSQDLFTSPGDLALAHKLALVMRKASNDHVDWQLPDFNGELSLIASNQRRFLGFSEDDSGFDPSHHAGKVVVSTMHKAKGLEWDRVYLMSVNNYDFPSNQPNDRYMAEKRFIRNNLNLEAETLAQLQACIRSGEYEFYKEGAATRSARTDYVRERLRLLFVGITRAKKELIITWNTGRQGDQSQAIPFVALQAWYESHIN